MFDGRANLSIQVVDEVKRYFKGSVYTTLIPRNVRLAEAPSHGKPVIYYDSKCKGAVAYMELAEEFIIFTVIYDGIAEFFTMISGLGVEIFTLDWVNAVVKLFSLFGWTLFVVGVVVSAFDLAIEYQNGRASIHGTAINWIKGFMAVSLFTVTPIELYKFCVSLQNTLSGDLTRIFASQQGTTLGEVALYVLKIGFYKDGAIIQAGLFELIALIALGYCVVKIFFDNIKRGGILLIQIAVGSLYMFSIPRGYGCSPYDFNCC